MTVGGDQAGIRGGATETWRVSGNDYTPWLANPSNARIKAYDAAGVRTVIRMGTLAVHCLDEDIAKDVDEREERHDI